MNYSESLTISCVWRSSGLGLSVLLIASMSLLGPTIQPHFSPLYFRSFPPEYIVMVLFHIPLMSDILGTSRFWQASKCVCSYTRSSSTTILGYSLRILQIYCSSASLNIFPVGLWGEFSTITLVRELMLSLKLEKSMSHSSSAVLFSGKPRFLISAFEIQDSNIIARWRNMVNMRMVTNLRGAMGTATGIAPTLRIL